MESRFDVLKDGLRVHSFIAGDSNNPPLILLHGFPTNALIWRKCFPELSRHFKVYATDLGDK